RQADPSAQLSIDIDRPWAEWMSSSHFQLGPLHLWDYLLRSDLGISSIGIEIAPGFTSPGSHLRDLFEFSRLLDLYSLLNVPLHLIMAMPSANGPDRRGHTGHLGGTVVGAGAGQAVCTVGDLASRQRPAAARLSPRRPVPAR